MFVIAIEIARGHASQMTALRKLHFLVFEPWLQFCHSGGLRSVWVLISNAIPGANAPPPFAAAAAAAAAVSGSTR